MTQEDIDNILLEQVIKSSLEEIDKSNQIDYEEEDNTKKDDFIAHLWELAQDSIEPLIYSKCQINVNAKISDQNVTFIVDTGAQTNVMTISTVQNLGLESFVDKNVKAKIFGVGTGEIIGIIPYLEIKFGNITCATNFYVMNDRKDESGKVMPLSVLLGFPFMMFYKIKLDFSKSKMEIMGHEIDIIIKEF